MPGKPFEARVSKGAKAVEIIALRAMACSDQRPCSRLGKYAPADIAPVPNGRVGRYCFHDRSVR